MDWELISDIASRNISLNDAMKEVACQYRDDSEPIEGMVSIEVDRSGIRGTFSRPEPWVEPMKLDATDADMFRSHESAPGKLLGGSRYGRLIPDDGNWSASGVVLDEGMLVDLRLLHPLDVVKSLVVNGPAKGNACSLTRFVYAGAQWAASTRFSLYRLLVHSHTDNVPRIEDQILSATLDGSPSAIEQQALWLLLSFISGNRLQRLVIERYNHAGVLIEREFSFGAAVSIYRKEPFRRDDASLSQRGMHLLGDGMLRLLNVKFPIGPILHHISESNTHYTDVDAQHLVLAIHTAIEAWNRVVGLEEWIDSKIWESYIRHVRRDLLSDIGDDIGPEMSCNILRALAHANRTTTAWRQSQLFSALGIDVTSGPFKQALKIRDELLHNGYFLARWEDLTALEQQERMDQIGQLRNLAHLLVYRLVGYDGRAFDFVTYLGYDVLPVALPTKLHSSGGTPLKNS
jgi:hypothetical protein